MTEYLVVDRKLGNERKEEARKDCTFVEGRYREKEKQREVEADRRSRKMLTASKTEFTCL